LSRRAARLDVRDVQTRSWATRGGRVRVDRIGLQPERRMVRHAVVDQLCGERLGEVNGDRETETYASATALARLIGHGGDGRVDADEVSSAVDECAAAVAGVDGRVSLDCIDE